VKNLSEVLSVALERKIAPLKSLTSNVGGHKNRKNRIVAGAA